MTLLPSPRNKLHDPAPVHNTCVLHAGSTVDVTPLKAKANALAQRRKYRTKELRTAGHNCSQEKPVISLWGFKMQPEKDIRGCAPEMGKRA
jgi:hypothetical protein